MSAFSVTLIGVVLMVAPWVLVLISRAPRRAIAQVSIAVIAVHLVVALLTQALGIFSYPVILGAHLVGIGVGAYMLWRYRTRIAVPSIDRVFVAVAAVLVLTLVPVHFSYNGTIFTVQGYQEVQDFSYTYPYFSDEWVAAAYVQQAVETGTLPLANPLNEQVTTPNFWLPFHSLVSEVVVLTGISVPGQWAYLSTVFGVLLAAAMYLFVRELADSRFAAAASALWVPYIVNGANLPASWYLIPFTFALIGILLAFTLWQQRSNIWALGGLALAVVLYPPFVLIAVPVGGTWLWYLRGRVSRHRRVLLASIAGGGMAVCVSAVLLLLSPYVTAGSFVDAVREAVVRTGLTGDAIPEFYIWRVVPLVTFGAALFGVRILWRDARWLYVPALIAGVLWIVYSQQILRFLIGYPRVVVLAAFLIVIAAGVGLHQIWVHLQRLVEQETGSTLPWTGATGVLIGAFLISAFFYTAHDDWRSLVLAPPGASEAQKIMPAAPANRYITESDTEIFSQIPGERFIAPPWKGLALGVTTGNVPLHTKSSAVTVKQLDFARFLHASCEKRVSLLHRHKARYAFTPRKECSQFRAVGTSSEGLVLYELLSPSGM